MDGLTNTYGTAQRQLDARTRSAGAAPEGDISSTRYEHAGALLGFPCVEQSLPVTGAGVSKIPALAVHYQTCVRTYVHTTNEGTETTNLSYVFLKCNSMGADTCVNTTIS